MQLRTVILYTSLFALPLSAQTNRILHPIDVRRTMPVPDQVHPKAQPQFDQGIVDASFVLNNLSLVLGPSAAQQADLDRFLASVQDPNSPNYQKWLTPEQFGDRFAASQSDYDQVVSWLEGQGFSIHTL